MRTLGIALSPSAPTDDMSLTDIIAGFHAADALYETFEKGDGDEEEIAEATYEPWFERLRDNPPPAKDAREAETGFRTALERLRQHDSDTARSLLEAIKPVIIAALNAAAAAEQDQDGGDA